MRLQIAIIALGLAVTNAFGCQPLGQKYWVDSPRRVKQNFDNAQFVVVATVIDVRTVTESARLDPNFKMELERAQFRVDRTFKGKLKPGDIFTIDSGRNTCARGVRDQEWVRPRQDPSKNQNYPRQWVIYHTSYPEIAGSPMQPPSFEITVSPLSRPVQEAGYDIKVLESLSRH